VPLPFVAGLVAGSFLAGIAKDLVADLIRDAIGNFPRGAIDYLKVEAFRDIFINWTAEFYQSLLAEPHTVSGLSPRGLVDIVISGLLTVAKMSMIFNPEITEELFLEIIQEGFSNAIQFSIGGAFQNILSFWRGSYGVQSGQSNQVLQAIDHIDDLTLTWLLMSSGEHVITLSLQMLIGLMQKYENDKSLQLAQVSGVVEYLNRLSFSYNETLRAEVERILARSARVAEEYYDRIIALADNLLERFISRVNEIDAETQSHLVLYDNGSISEDTMRAVLIENTLLLDSTKQSYDYFIALLNDEATNASSLTNLVDPKTYNSAMQAIAIEYAKLIGAITFRDYTSRLIDVLDRINTARTYNFTTGQSQTAPIQLLGPPPAMPPEPPGTISGTSGLDIVSLEAPSITT
jgi:hypothetical protein